MRPDEVLVRMRNYLQGLTWTGSANKIFGNSVYVVGETPIMQISQFVRPCAFVVDQGVTNHAEHPGLMTQVFTILVFVENVGKNYGEGGMLGRNRTANTSQGAGVKEILNEIMINIIKTIELENSSISLISKSMSKASFVGSNIPLYFSSISLQAFCWVY